MFPLTHLFETDPAFSLTLYIKQPIDTITANYGGQNGKTQKYCISIRFFDF